MISLWTALHRRLLRYCQSIRCSCVEYRRQQVHITFPKVCVYCTPYSSFEPILIPLQHLYHSLLALTVLHASNVFSQQYMPLFSACSIHDAEMSTVHLIAVDNNGNNNISKSHTTSTRITTNYCSRDYVNTTLKKMKLHNVNRFYHSSWQCTINSNNRYCNKQALYTSRRTLATAVRRPTFEEITSALSILGMSYSNAIDAKLLKSKYRELVKSNHPDTGGDAAKMAQITVAYERLANMTKYEWMSYHSQHSAAMARGHNLHHTNPYAARYATHSNPSHYAFYGNHGDNKNGYYSMNHDNASQSQSSHTASASNSFYGNGYYAQSKAQQQQQQQAYWNFYRQRASSTGNSSDPFSKYNRSSNGMYGGGTSWVWNNPLFSFNSRGKYQHNDHGPFNRANSVFQTGNVLVQVFIAYLIISVLFLFCYRFYRDGNYEDGWKMAEKLARQEQIEELQRIRREMNERLRLHGGGWVPPEWHNRTVKYDEFEKQIPREQLVRHVRQNTNYNNNNNINNYNNSTKMQQSRSNSYKTLSEGNLPHSQRRQQEKEPNQLLSTQSPVLQSSTLQTSNHNSTSKAEETTMKGWPAVDPSVGQVYQAEIDPRGVVTFEPSTVQSDHAAMPNQAQITVGQKNIFGSSGNNKELNASTHLNSNMTNMADNISPVRQSTEDEVMSTLREILGKQQKLA